jgi:hypothetical protein
MSTSQQPPQTLGWRTKVRNWLQIVRSLAVWLVKSAIRDAATGLGISLSDAELNVLADIAVDALTA